MNSVADKILLQFADNFAAEVAALQEPGAARTGDGTQKAAARARELNALALAWAVFKDWLRSLFSKNKA